MYLAEHPAVALIDVLVNLRADPELLPETYQLIKVEAPKSLAITELSSDALPENWRENRVATQALGDAWLKAGKTALLAVPSVPSPESLNYLLNPLHRDAPRLAVAWCKRLEYDQRLFQLR